MKALALALAFLALSPAVAAADQVSDFTSIGRAFWAERNVQVPTGLTVSVVALPCGFEADGCVNEVGGTDLQLSASLIREASRERARRGEGGDSARLNLCRTVVHELGHAAGLEHTTTGLMSPVGGDAPWACEVWVTRHTRAELARAARFSRR